jgi:hypothetical protein
MKFGFAFMPLGLAGEKAASWNGCRYFEFDALKTRFKDCCKASVLLVDTFDCYTSNIFGPFFGRSWVRISPLPGETA